MIKLLLITVGCLSLALGVLGLLLPLLPTVPFVLLAAFCFAKSSERFHRKLMSNRVFGPMIHDWQTSRSVPRKSKYIAIVSIVASGAFSIYLIDSLFMQLVVVLLLCVPITLILSVATTESLVPSGE